VTKRSVEAIVDALNAAGVRYLIAGGLAVVAHGYLRFTADVNLVLDLEPGNVTRAIDALEATGYRLRVPVPFQAFADATTRAQWVRERNTPVFSLWSDAHAATEIDLFVELSNRRIRRPRGWRWRLAWRRCSSGIAICCG
jgi:hypothetical protein